MPVETLLPHEQVEDKQVDKLERMTLRWKAYTKPLLVDRKTGTILDGHHRAEVAQRMELQCLPCVLVDYLGDDRVTLTVWPSCSLPRHLGTCSQITFLLSQSLCLGWSSQQ